MVSVNRGFALLIVLWVVAILSAVSLALISSARVEARASADGWDRLAGQRLVRSGQELGQFLRLRGLGQANQDLRGMPVDIETPGFRYRLRFPEGVVELVLESDIGKISPATADPQFLLKFAALWKGDAAAGQELAESLEDWCDADSEVRANGAESGFYSPLGYAPRNYMLGIADLTLVRGLGAADFIPRISAGSSRSAAGLSGISEINVRESLDDFVTTIATGGQINPNFAPMMVLLAVPGLSEDQAENIVRARKDGVFFRDLDGFRSSSGLPADSPALQYFRFDQWLAPTWLTLVRDGSGRAVQSERRVYEMVLAANPVTGSYETASRLHRIELDRMPEFLQ